MLGSACSLAPCPCSGEGFPLSVIELLAGKAHTHDSRLRPIESSGHTPLAPLIILPCHCNPCLTICLDSLSISCLEKQGRRVSKGMRGQWSGVSSPCQALNLLIGFIRPRVKDLWNSKRHMNHGAITKVLFVFNLRLRSDNCTGFQVSPQVFPLTCF